MVASKMFFAYLYQSPSTVARRLSICFRLNLALLKLKTESQLMRLQLEDSEQMNPSVLLISITFEAI